LSVSILTTNIGGVDDKRIVLNNGSISRKISIGNTWNRLRIFARFSWDDAGANIGGSPRLWFGVHSNPQPNMSNGPLTASCSHFVGLRTPSATWARSAGPVKYTVTHQDGLCKKVGNTESPVVGSWAASSHFKPGVNTTRHPLWLEFTKGAPNFTVVFWCPDDATYPDVDYAELMSLTEQRTAATARQIWANIAGGAFSQINGSATIAVDENANGPLNSICVGWDEIVANCYVSEMQWSIMA